MDTERLIIRRFCPSDWSDLHEYLSQPEVVKYEPYGTFTEDASKQETQNRTDNDSFWAVCLKDSGKLIGNIYLAKQDFDTWELGYVFNFNYQKKGYAIEAARALVDDAFRVHHARRVTATCNPLNTASWKLLECLGMRREGHLRENIYFKVDENNQPIWADTFEYAVLVSEWLTEKENITL